MVCYTFCCSQFLQKLRATKCIAKIVPTAFSQNENGNTINFFLKIVMIRKIIKEKLGTK